MGMTGCRLLSSTHKDPGWTFGGKERLTVDSFFSFPEVGAGMALKVALLQILSVTKTLIAFYNHLFGENHMKLLVSKLSLAVALILGLSATGATAGIITFDFSNRGTNANSLSFASGGVTVTVNNPTGNGTHTGFQTDSDGLFISNAGAAFNLGALTGMNIKFSVDAKITAYSVGYTQGLSASTFFNLTGGRAGAASSLNNSLASAGSYNLTSDYILDANQAGTFAATVNGGSTRLAELKTLTIDTNVVPVPEPSTITIAGIGIGMAGWSAWKKRRVAKGLAKK